MVTTKNIEVVMPTYNGAHFVEEQISSIFNQTIRPSRLLVVTTALQMEHYRFFTASKTFTTLGFTSCQVQKILVAHPL